jgi:7,8-dihydroneopterin aldolase/epimerase/oxygenase
VFTIQLTNLQFFCFHGVYEEERLLGGEFVVDAHIDFTASGTITSLDQTVDYCKIYECIKQRMQQPTALLETVAQDLATAIGAVDDRICSVHISIKKVNPPIQQFTGSIAVCYKKAF